MRPCKLSVSFSLRILYTKNNNNLRVIRIVRGFFHITVNAIIERAAYVWAIWAFLRNIGERDYCLVNCNKQTITTALFQ